MHVHETAGEIREAVAARLPTAGASTASDCCRRPWPPCTRPSSKTPGSPSLAEDRRQRHPLPRIEPEIASASPGRELEARRRQRRARHRRRGQATTISTCSAGCAPPCSPKGVSGDAAALPAHRALRMATLNGLRALRLGEQTARWCRASGPMSSPSIRRSRKAGRCITRSRSRLREQPPPVTDDVRRPPAARQPRLLTLDRSALLERPGTGARRSVWRERLNPQVSALTEERMTTANVDQAEVAKFDAPRQPLVGSGRRVQAAARHQPAAPRFHQSRAPH